jgi:hypothetical protein
MGCAITQGYQTAGLYLDQGIGQYSVHSREKVEHFATFITYCRRKVVSLEKKPCRCRRQRSLNRVPYCSMRLDEAALFRQYALDGGFVVRQQATI